MNSKLSVRGLLRGLADKTPGIAGLIMAKRLAEQRHRELRDAIGDRLLERWLKELELPPIANTKEQKCGPVAHVTWSIRRGGAAEIVQALHAATLGDWDSLVFYGNGGEHSADAGFRPIARDSLASAMTDYGRAHSLRGFTSTTTDDLIATLLQEDVGLVHLHNVHPDYFNLLRLPQLSARIPTVWTLHDEYAYTGHCGVTMDCDGWTRSCQPCPYVNRYVELSADRAVEHYQLKHKVYQKSRLTVVCVSEWLASRVRRSILAGQDVRVIRNGIDTNQFKPVDQSEARRRLRLPLNRALVGFCADGGVSNPWKGGKHLQRVASGLDGHDCTFVCVGGEKSQSRGSIIELGYLTDRESMVDAYCAVDVWLHPSEADSFGLVVAEAMSCGTPVISSDAGALPELIENGQSGVLVGKGDIESFRNELRSMLSDEVARRAVGAAGRKRIQSHFSRDRMVVDYLRLYEELLANRQE